MRNKAKGLFKAVAMVTAGAMLFGITGCGNGKSNSSSSSSSQQSAVEKYLTDGVVDDQFASPQPGEEYAVLTVGGYGVIKMRLFPEVAPKAVENFKTLAKQGAYTGVPFHRIVEDFMIQSGDTSRVGGTGDSIYGEGFAVELNESVHHFSGALAVARTSDMDNGQSTQFYIVSNQSVKNYTEAMWDQIQQRTGTNYSEDTRALYKEYGGAPSLDMQYTIMGQVFEGQDVVDKIASAETKAGSNGGENSEPSTPILISSLQILTA